MSQTTGTLQSSPNTLSPTGSSVQGYTIAATNVTRGVLYPSSTGNELVPAENGLTSAIDTNSWQYNTKIQLDYTYGSDDLHDFIVKLELDQTNFDFTKAKSDGSDIRFTDEYNQTEYKFWIEKWDSTNKEAIIWIKIPLITAGQINVLLIWYGNTNASKVDNIDSAYLKLDLTNDNTGSGSDATTDTFWWDDGTQLGQCTDTDQTVGSYVDCSLDVSSKVTSGISGHHIYWQYTSGNDSGHVRNIRLEITVNGELFTFWDQYGHTDFNTAGDGGGNASQLDLESFKQGEQVFVDSGNYNEHYFGDYTLLKDDGARVFYPGPPIPLVELENTNSYTYTRTITLDHTVIESDVYSFAIVVRFDQSNFNFDHIQTDDGSDIVFLTESGAILPFLREKFDSSNKIALFHIFLPHIRSDQDTTIQVIYGATGLPDHSSTFDKVLGQTGQVAHYSFDGNANDLSGKYNGTWDGTEQYDTGVLDQAAKFDGSSGIKVTNFSNYDSDRVTISLWFDITSMGSSSTGILFNTGQYTLEVAAFSNYLQYAFGAGWAWHQGSTQISTGQFYHLYVTYRKSTGIVDSRVNLVQDYTGTNKATNAWATLGIGQRYDGSNQPLTGLIDPLRIYSRPLLSDEISLLYNSEKSQLVTLGEEKTQDITQTSQAKYDILTGQASSSIYQIYTTVNTQFQSSYQIFVHQDVESSYRIIRLIVSSESSYNILIGKTDQSTYDIQIGKTIQSSYLTLVHQDLSSIYKIKEINQHNTSSYNIDVGRKVSSDYAIQIAQHNTSEYLTFETVYNTSDYNILVGKQITSSYESFIKKRYQGEYKIWIIYHPKQICSSSYNIKDTDAVSQYVESRYDVAFEGLTSIDERYFATVKPYVTYSSERTTHLHLFNIYTDERTNLVGSYFPYSDTRKSFVKREIIKDERDAIYNRYWIEHEDLNNVTSGYQIHTDDRTNDTASYATPYTNRYVIAEHRATLDSDRSIFTLSYWNTYRYGYAKAWWTTERFAIPAYCILSRSYADQRQAHAQVNITKLSVVRTAHTESCSLSISCTINPKYVEISYPPVQSTYIELFSSKVSPYINRFSNIPVKWDLSGFDLILTNSNGSWWVNLATVPLVYLPFHDVTTNTIAYSGYLFYRHKPLYIRPEVILPQVSGYSDPRDYYLYLREHGYLKIEIYGQDLQDLEVEILCNTPMTPIPINVYLYKELFGKIRIDFKWAYPYKDLRVKNCHLFC